MVGLGFCGFISESTQLQLKAQTAVVLVLNVSETGHGLKYNVEDLGSQG